ncbi:MAG TPA: SDR family NAD(P)-dependent oxidoreductase, partial [Thermomicrobiales bacterium]|nr:SDR family NAD(P)-dependent oxidoreductase [Thermomicrobiales bacterium]
MRVLITGATGFVGAHATAAFAGAGHDVVALHHGPRDERLIAAIARNDSTNVRFVRADVRDFTAVDRIVRDAAPTHVVHAAAITPNPAQETGEPGRVVATNELGTLNLLVAAARHGAFRFVLV